MSSTSTFVLGLGGGLALWYATQRRPDRATTEPTASPVADERTMRNARRATRDAGVHNPTTNDASSAFTLATYPSGVAGRAKRVRWFLAAPPTTWSEARKRLAAAGLLDPRAIGPNMAGYWRLTTDKRVWNANRAEPLPVVSKTRLRGARTAKPRYTHAGRTILRDGDAILYVDRVDLGDHRYAVSPYEADQLTARMVRLLDRHGAR